jgi:hypothetical protein
MRSFAKATSHLFTLAPLAIDPTADGAVGTASLTVTTPTPTRFGPLRQSAAVESVHQSEEDSGLIDETNGVVLDKLFSTIGRYLQSMGLGDTPPPPSSPTPSPSSRGGGKPFSAEEINNFVSQLTVSTNVPVTAAILQVPFPPHLCLSHTLSSQRDSKTSRSTFVCSRKAKARMG